METISLASEGVKLDKDYAADLEVLLSLVPNKMAFKIGEISNMLGLKKHVLRYWESEFQGLKPKKSNNNQRMYTRREIELLLIIRKFLYVDKFSISGTQRALKYWKKEKKQKKILSLTNKLDNFQDDLKSLIVDIKNIKGSVI